MSHYIQYYDEQVGGGGIRNVFTGSSYQRGRGVGSWLGGLFRRILPYVTAGAKAVGKEAIRTGLNIFDDVTNNNTSFNESLKTRTKESGKKLTKNVASKISDFMNGSGYKLPTSLRRLQSGNKLSSNSLKNKYKRKLKKKIETTKKKKEKEDKKSDKKEK